MIVLRDRVLWFSQSATLEELEAIERRTFVNHQFTKLAGVSHRNRDGTDRQQIIARCSAGEVLVLTHEEGNPADPNAVAVFRENGEQLGYLSREAAQAVFGGARRRWQYSAVISARSCRWTGLRGTGEASQFPSVATRTRPLTQRASRRTWPI